jgi:hypothetical protein
MGMTWRVRVQGLLVVLMMLGMLALAVGADWIDSF